MKKSITILGLGQIGIPTGLALLEAGYSVKGSTTRPEKLPLLESQGLNPFLLKAPAAPSKEQLASDIVLLNIPPKDGQLEWFQSWPWQKSIWTIFLSSTSVYASHSGKVNEDSPLAPGILSSEEEWIKTQFLRHSILRLGGLLGSNRHPGKHLSGKKNLAQALAPVNLIHHDDVVGAIKSVIEKKCYGTMNVVSDEHHTRKEFYTEYCFRHGLPLPEFDESDNSSGKTVSNERLKAIYQLKWPTIFGKSI